MALQNFWGFEDGLVPQDFIGESLSGFPVLSTSTLDPANGNFCLTVDNLATSVTTISVPVKQNTAELFVGFNFKINTLDINTEILTYNVGETYIAVSTSEDASLAVSVRSMQWRSNRGAFIGKTRPGVLHVDRWVYLGFNIKAHETQGLIEIYHNGISLASFNKIDTGKNSNNRKLFVGGKPALGSMNSFIDDLVVADSLGSTFNTMFAPMAVEAFDSSKKLKTKPGHKLLAASVTDENSQKKIVSSSLTEEAIRKLAKQ